MAGVFADSFDPYTSLGLKWSSGTAEFNSVPSFVRTGLQSLHPVQAGGFDGVPRVNFSTRGAMTAGAAFFPQALGEQIWFWYNQANGQGVCQLSAVEDGSIQVVTGNVIIANSAAGVLQTGVFNYIEASGIFATAGRLIVKVNGAVVIDFVGDTVQTGVPGVNGFLLPGSATRDVYFDDLYLVDDSGSENNTFLGPIQVFAIYPDNNETPLDFTPLSGTNFSEVNQFPPPGDAAYVFDGDVGDIDQYHYTITGPVGAFAIQFIQHGLCCKLDAPGAHLIGSQINAFTNDTPQIGTNAVGSDYAYILFVWDVNPNTGVAFEVTDFSTTFVGPKITG
jgi:hypothetical protein